MVTCPCCDSRIASGKSVSLCKQCDTLIVPADMKLKYGKDYFLNYIKYRNNELNDRIQEIRWDTVKKYKKCGCVLDIGCGVGAFLGKKSRLFFVEGYEVNPHCVEYCRRLGFEMLDALPTSGNYDVVTMFDVIEHVPNPATFIETAKKLLAIEGILVVATPNFTKDLVPSIKSWKHYKPGEHLYGFSKQSMEALCEKLGLRILSTNDDESQHRLPEGNIATYVISKATVSAKT